VLKFFYSLTSNYGWAIIFLTIIVRIPFIPLINKSQKSMKKMQEIQPRMAEVKEKYKKDPQRMQKEMMELYKKHKVNPVGGCLPMLLQIPVFFALYKILLIAIELRDAPFMLWIKDLSAPDTLFGHIPSLFPLIGGFALGPLPLVMGITMLIQQKMTPTSADPRQNKIMMFMPIIFTFMFLNFASGLVLYWLMNNILSIAQQFYINKKVKKEAA
jgi:YidC/Oxa1 family membrane protein insertase